MSEMLQHLSKALPLIAVISAICGFIGWWIRGLGSAKPAPAKASPVAERSGQDRAKNLEATLEKSKAANKALKAELEELKTASVARQSHEQALSELETARQSLATESRRAGALEVDLKKIQENLKVLNTRANEADKAQKDRGFTLQNELSKAREELAVLQSRPDESSVLQDEIERLRESVANATRYAGELRKREANAIEELEKIKTRFANSKDAATAPAVVKAAPVGDSDRVAAAKAEVLRLLEENRKKSAAAVLPVTAIAPIAGVVEPALAETLPEAEPEISPAEEAPAVVQEDIQEDVPEAPPVVSETSSPEPAVEETEATEPPTVAEAPAVEEAVAVVDVPAVLETPAEEEIPAHAKPSDTVKAPPGELFALD